MQKLKENNILIYIISASPEFFVKGSAKTVSIPQSQIYGIKVITKKGTLTSTVEQPITYAEGKTAMVKKILSQLKREHKTPHVYAIAAFGNSYKTDGHFLTYIATQKLPAGKPIAVMINGGHYMDECKGLFYCVNQSTTVQ